MAMRRYAVALISLVSLGLMALMPLAGGDARAEEKPLVVFAAASLKNALDDIGTAWVASGHARPLISYAASGPLAKQIEAGAPADLFIAADLDWMDYAQKKALIVEKSRVTLLGNRLVLVVPKTSTATISLVPGAPLAALLGDGRLAIGEPQSVPAGKYGRLALETLGLWDAVAGKLAMADSVRAALLLVGRGEAPAGIVYQTDAAVEPNVKIIATFPEATHPPILYPAAVVAASVNQQASAFLAFLQQPAARAAFEYQGFTVVVAPAAN